MKHLFRKFLVILVLLSTLTSAQKSKTTILNGRYYWEWTEVENQAYLVRKKQETTISRFTNHIEFSSNKFKDIRMPSCGNDISYKKTGTYTLTSKQLVLDYRGGEFHDNVGGDSMQVYVKSKVFYQVLSISKNRDTILILWHSGKTTKNAPRVQ